MKCIICAGLDFDLDGIVRCRYRVHYDDDGEHEDGGVEEILSSYMTDVVVTCLGCGDTFKLDKMEIEN